MLLEQYQKYYQLYAATYKARKTASRGFKEYLLPPGPGGQLQTQSEEEHSDQTDAEAETQLREKRRQQRTKQ